MRQPQSSHGQFWHIVIEHQPQLQAILAQILANRFQRHDAAGSLDAHLQQPCDGRPAPDGVGYIQRLEQHQSAHPRALHLKVRSVCALFACVIVNDPLAGVRNAVASAAAALAVVGIREISEPAATTNGAVTVVVVTPAASVTVPTALHRPRTSWRTPSRTSSRSALAAGSLTDRPPSRRPGSGPWRWSSCCQRGYAREPGHSGPQ